ncbi:MAG: hypothetical protein A2020_07745 [Lentisphaerae bacterium GWF2_45_14]|nr:MAG: hypothetical protein A2020_07745 [Lentisphaerae bacterium GWF2_45_14]
MKLLVTGSSGLLGSDIVYLAERRNISTVKVCLSQRPGFISADITTEEGIKTIRNLEWDALVHTAAWRDPNVCEKDPDKAYSINGRATGLLASLAKERNAKFLYISTDYVFPGTNPPYREVDPVKPLNIYGKAKLAGEEAVRKISDHFLILRVPALYGIRAGLAASPLIDSTLKALDSGKDWDMEDTIIKYPTYTGDVADVVLFLLGKNASGTYQFSGQEKGTRYEMALAIAEATGKSSAKIRRMPAPPEADATRPIDAHLCMDKLIELGFDSTLPSFKERVRQLWQAGLLGS